MPDDPGRFGGPPPGTPGTVQSRTSLHALPMTPTPRVPSCAELGRHPDHDHPPDDHPPNRWTRDGRWADDPCTDHDLDLALTSLLDEANRTDRARRATAGRTSPALTTSAPLSRVDTLGSNDPPPF